MNKQEILNEIEKTKEHLANMEKMLEDCECERWKPEEGEEYYYLDFGLKFHTVENFNYPSDIMAINAYNCFETEKEAKQEAEKILIRRQLEDIARRLNKGQKIDWNNERQNKYYIRFNYWKDIIELDHTWENKFQGTICCSDKNFLYVAIQESEKND